MSENTGDTFFRQKLEVLILSQSEPLHNRAKQIISAHRFSFRELPFSAIGPNMELDLLKAQLILLSQEEEEELGNFAKRVDKILKQFPRARVVTLMGAAFSRENFEGSQNPRVTPLSQVEFYQTLKFEYLCIYRCRSQYFEIKPNDLFPATTMNFPAFIRLSLNQRYLAVVYSNMILSDERFHRLEESEGLYIQAKDSERYLQYLNTYYDTSGAGLKKRARALFLTLYSYSLRLNEILLFDFKSSSEEEIGEIYLSLQNVAKELFEVLKSDENLWDLFREAAPGELNLYWRSPWIATYAALIAVKSGQGDPLVTLLAGLLTDVGLYDLEEKMTRQFLLADEKAFAEKEQRQFVQHPILSLNRCLAKKLPLEDKIKSVMVCAHERADQTGFPNQVPSDNLPVEAQILLFAEKIDQGVLTTMKQTGVGFRFLKEKLWEAETAKPGDFSPAFLQNIADSLL